MKIGDKVPALSFSTTNEREDSFNNYRGRWLIVYFYPKDATPGCTTEGQEFRDAYSQIQKLNAEVLGISRDSLQSHEKFKCKQQFPFELVSDPQETVCKLFAVIKIKNMYGKQVLGIERSTFIIDPEGFLKYEWRKIQVKDHVVTVINTLKALQN